MVLLSSYTSRMIGQTQKELKRKELRKMIYKLKKGDQYLADIRSRATSRDRVKAIFTSEESLAMIFHSKQDASEQAKRFNCEVLANV